MIPIEGHCPFGCGPTLAVVFEPAHTALRCFAAGCPAPNFVHELLQPRDPVHLLRITAGVWNLIHPLCERYEDALLGCEIPLLLEDWMVEQPDGTYRVEQHDGEILCIPLDQETAPS